MELRPSGSHNQKTPQSVNRARTVVPLPLNSTTAKSKPASTAQQGQAHRMKKKGRTLPPSSNRPCREHSFLTDVADVRQMEQGLLQLLDDFHSGKLQAFGEDCPIEKMDQVREQQERLARLHFELDSHQELKGLDSAEAKEAANKNRDRLMENLQNLCTSVQNLHKADHLHPHHHN